MAYGFGNYQPFGTGYQPQNYYQPQNIQHQSSPGVRYVASREEVVAAQIPFDGNPTYFVDTYTGKIYVKAFDPNTGAAPIVTYTKEDERPVQYATIDDLNALRAEINAFVKERRVVQNDANE